MLDWKILAASFVALLVVSSVLLGGFGIGEFFSDLINKIGEWLGSSPFGGFFSTPTAKTKEIDIVLYPANLSLKPDSSINVSTDMITLTNFKGEISTDFENETLIFKESDSSLIVEIPLERITIPDLQIKKMSFENVRFDMKPNITGENGSIEIYDFLGKGIIAVGSVEFQGNVSKMTVKIGDMEWEVK